MAWESLKKEVETIINPALSEAGLALYQIKQINDFGGPGIEILVIDAQNPNQNLDFEILTNLNEKISILLDQKLQLSNHYYLIVGTKGLESEITSEEELIQALDKFVAIDLKAEANPKTISHFKGVIIGYNESTKTFALEYFVKGQKRKINFAWSQVHYVRHAAKV